ncbi:MAG: hypothetical protein RL095_2856 [Verrucomicrobiota bacterium]|jgi:glutamate-1-semialdehyde 2,1-aminomutase
MDSATLHARASKLVPGGVHSPVRAFRAVGGNPVFFKSAQGGTLTTVEGREIVDFVLSWGPSLLGHCHPEVVRAVQEQASTAFSFGMCSELEVELAEMIHAKIKGMEMLRFVSSGTEATMSALRLARGFTGRDGIIKFDGCYHGHSDALLVKAGSGVATFGTSSSAGVPADFAKHTICVDFNNLQSVEDALKLTPVAAVIVEPVPGNMGLVIPEPGFLQGLRRLCDQYGALLIFDEVMCAFRVSPTTAAELFGVMPDLFCFGKVIGGGLPVGAFGGRADVMQLLAPLGPVYQAGTLSGNPLAMRAGLETLRLWFNGKGFDKTESLGRDLDALMAPVVAGRGDVKWIRLGSMFTLFFLPEGATLPKNMEEVRRCDFGRFGRFFQFMMKKGFLIPPAQYEANFLSTAHTHAQLKAYATATAEFLASDKG